MNTYNVADVIPILKRHYQEGRLIPFLGAGFSKPLGLPNWESLIRSIAKDLDFEDDLFVIHGSFTQLAEYVELTNRRVWKKFINRMIRGFDSSEAICKRKDSITHQALAKLNFRTIYTTNYDAHIEGALDDVGKPNITLTSLADFLEPRDPNECEIVKFHGTLQDPDTIVLTESHYFERMQLEDAADQRLRSDILSNSFLFIGYRFNDPNIRYIWYRIHKLRKQQGDENRVSLRPCYFATFGANPVQPSLLERWNIKVILLDPIDKSESVANLLNSIGEL